MGFFTRLLTDIASLPGNYARGFAGHPRDNYLAQVCGPDIEEGPTRFHLRESGIIICGTPADAGFVNDPDNAARDFTGTKLPSGFLVPAAPPGYGWYRRFYQNHALLVLSERG